MLAGAAALTALDTKARAADANRAAIDPKNPNKITKLEMIPVHRTRCVLLKVHTDAGIEVDDEALSRLDDPDWNFPTPFDADDGSVRDW
jgi:hypothetical protein